MYGGLQSRNQRLGTCYAESVTRVILKLLKHPEIQLLEDIQSIDPAILTELNLFETEIIQLIKDKNLLKLTEKNNEYIKVNDSYNEYISSVTQQTTPEIPEILTPYKHHIEYILNISNNVNQINDSVIKLNGEFDKLKDALDKLTVELDKLTTEHNTLTDTLDNLNNARNKLVNDINNNNAQIEAINNNINIEIDKNNTAKIAEETLYQNKYTTEIDKLNKQQTNIITKLDSYKNLTNITNSDYEKINSLQNEFINCQSNKESLNKTSPKEFSKILTKYSDAQSEIRTTTESEINKLTTVTSDLHTQLDIIDKDILIIQEELAKTISKFNKIVNNKDEISNKILTIRNTIDINNKEVNSQNNTILSLVKLGHDLILDTYTKNIEKIDSDISIVFTKRSNFLKLPQNSNLKIIIDKQTEWFDAINNFIVSKCGNNGSSPWIIFTWFQNYINKPANFTQDKQIEGLNNITFTTIKNNNCSKQHECVKWDESTQRMVECEVDYNLVFTIFKSLHNKLTSQTKLLKLTQLNLTDPDVFKIITHTLKNNLYLLINSHFGKDSEFIKLFENSSRLDELNNTYMLTPEYCNKSTEDKKNDAHALTITGMNEEYVTIKNSWGYQWGEFGKFKIKKEYLVDRLCITNIIAIDMVTSTDTDPPKGGKHTRQRKKNIKHRVTRKSKHSKKTKKNKSKPRIRSRHRFSKQHRKIIVNIKNDRRTL